ncbi:MAG: hypothetical protein WC216_12115 [Gallionella sp.]|jgi:hypothetical protein
MNYLEEMFITLVLVLAAFFILFRFAQLIFNALSKLLPIKNALSIFMAFIHPE